MGERSFKNVPKKSAVQSSKCQNKESNIFRQKASMFIISNHNHRLIYLLLNLSRTIYIQQRIENA